MIAAQRAIALAIESEDRWVVAQAHWAASHVPCARGDWAVAEGACACDPRAPRRDRAQRRRRRARVRVAGRGPGPARPRCWTRSRRCTPCPAARAWTIPPTCPGSTSRRRRCSTPAGSTRPRRISTDDRGSPLMAARLACVRGAAARRPRAGHAEAAAAFGEAEDAGDAVRAGADRARARALAAARRASGGPLRRCCWPRTRGSSTSARARSLRALRAGARRVRTHAVRAQDARLLGAHAAGARGRAARRVRHDQPRDRHRADGVAPRPSSTTSATSTPSSACARAASCAPERAPRSSPSSP